MLRYQKKTPSPTNFTTKLKMRIFQIAGINFYRMIVHVSSTNRTEIYHLGRKQSWQLTKSEIKATTL